jgi:hypothetical protein
MTNIDRIKYFYDKKVIIPIHQNDNVSDMQKSCTRLFNRMRKSIEEWENKNCPCLKDDRRKKRT